MNNLESQVLRVIGDDPSSPDVFLDTPAGIAPIRDSINDAIHETVMLTGSHEDTFHIPLLADQKFYRLNFARGFFGWVVDVWLVGNRRRLEQTDMVRLWADDPRWLRNSGDPWQYFQVGANTIGIDRSPGSSTDLIEVQCVVIPAAYTEDADRPTIRKQFEHAVINYAVSEYWASRGDARSAVDHLERYLEGTGSRLSYKPAKNRFVMPRPAESVVSVGDRGGLA